MQRWDREARLLCAAMCALADDRVNPFRGSVHIETLRSALQRLVPNYDELMGRRAAALVAFLRRFPRVVVLFCAPPDANMRVRLTDTQGWEQADARAADERRRREAELVAFVERLLETMPSHSCTMSQLLSAVPPAMKHGNMGRVIRRHGDVFVMNKLGVGLAHPPSRRRPWTTGT